MAYNSIDRRIDREAQVNRAKLKPGLFINAEALDIYHYLSLTEEERFEALMKLYEKAEPSWVAKFNELENKKPAKMRINLDSKTTMDELIESAEGDDLCQTAMAMYTANKLAHLCENARNILLGDYFKNKINLLYNSGSDRDARVLSKATSSRKDFRELSNTIYAYFDPANQSKPNLLRKLENQLYSCGIDQNDITTFRNLGIDKLSIKQRNGYYLKDIEMMNLISKLQSRDDVAYGMVVGVQQDENGNTIMDKKTGMPKQSHLMVVDLPYYGQFSVHMKTAQSISALSATPYSEARVFESESMILTDQVSEYAKRFDLDKRGTITMKRLKEIKEKDPRYAHYLALKTGSGKEELDEMHSDR